MVVRSDTEIFDPFPIKLAGWRIAVKILHEKLELAAECLEIIELHAGSGGYVEVPIVLFPVFHIHRQNRSHCRELNTPGASELNAIVYQPGEIKWPQ